MQLDRIKVGASVVLISLEGVAAALGTSVEEAEGLVQAWGLVPVYVTPGTKRYVNMYALESFMFAASLPSGMREKASAHQELAGVLYGAIQKEVIERRVREASQALGLRRKPGRPKGSGKKNLKKVKDDAIVVGEANVRESDSPS